jgi:lipopolysaccharide exporter
MLGATALGLYQMAYKIPEATITVVIWVVSKVLFPAFSRIQQSGRDLRSAYLQALRYVGFLTIPMAAGLFLIAGPLVLLVFGPAWAGAIPLLRWLAIYGGVRSLGTHAGDVLKATGRSGLLAVLGLVKGAILIPLLILAGRKGVEPVAMTMAGVTAFTALLNVIVVKRFLHFRWADVVRALSVSSAAGVVLVVVALGAQALVADAGPLVVMVVTMVASAAAYFSAAFLLDRTLVTEVVDAVFRRGAEGEAAA